MSGATAERSDLVTRAQAAAYLRLRPKTLAQWKTKGTGPPIYRIGGRALYRLSDLDEYIESHREAS